MTTRRKKAMGFVILIAVNGNDLQRLLIPLMLTIFLGCKQKMKESPSQHALFINPNGDSELALLMREMFTESDSLRNLVLEAKELSGLRKFETIHSAVATDPSVRGPVFDAFSDAYINSIKKLEKADTSTVFNFNRMVDQCMNCHTEFCPGPRKRIKKLYIR